METFTLGWGRSWLVRLFGRNELIRGNDRLEACCAALAVLAVIVALPVSAAWGTHVKESRESIYAGQWQTRHQTAAVATEDATVDVEAAGRTLTVPARWTTGGRTHAAIVSPADTVRAGDRFDIWVDESGDHVKAPTPLGRAVSDAIGSAVLSWLAVASTLALCTSLLHRRLTRARYGAWDRELDALAGDGGGRASH